MKQYGIIIGLILIFGNMAKAQTNSVDSLIEYYHKYPQTAIETADSLFRVAEKQKDKGQWLQALILRNTFLLKKDAGLYPQQLNELEEFIRKEKDAAARSMLHSYAGELYKEYYDANIYKISSRTEVEGKDLQDINTWTSGMFTDKIREHLLASIAEKETLQGTPADRYEKAMITGKDSRRLRPTLYDFLCHRAIDLLPEVYAKEDTLNASAFSNAQTFAAQPQQEALHTNETKLNIYRELIAFHLQDATPEALLAVDLERLYFALIACRAEEDGLWYETALEHLRQQYKGLPIEVEIMAEQAQRLYAKTRGYPRLPIEETRTLRKRAIEICREGIREYTEYERISLLKSIQQQIEMPDLRMETPRNIYPGEPFQIETNHQNIRQLQVNIYRLPDRYFVLNSRREWKEIPGKLVKTYDFELPEDVVFQDTLLELAGLPAGCYVIETSSPKMEKKCHALLLSTQLCPIVHKLADNIEIHVYDWNSGKPVSQAKVLLYTRKGELVDSLKTNSEGYVICPKRKYKDLHYQVVNAENPSGNIEYLYYSSQNNWNVREEHYALFTDRKIYRPGQTVYYKGYCWMSAKDTLCARTGLKGKVTFYDANGQELASQEVRTNRYGTVSGSFVIPTTTLNGSFRLTFGNNSEYITVAEYKRPEFEITLQAPDAPVYGGDTVRIQGNVKSFSGVAVADTKVSYTISGIYHNSTLKSIYDTLTTDAAGNFEIVFSAAPLEAPRYQDIYDITATATDSKGETQKGNLYLSVYSGQAIPELNFPERVDKTQKNTFEISLENYGKKVEREVRYAIAKVVAPKEVNGRIDTTLEKTVLSGQLALKGKGGVELDLQNEASGIYLFTAECEGRKAEKIFFLYSPEDKRPPYPTDWWLIERKTCCAIGEKMDILVGTSLEDTHVEVKFIRPEKIVYRKSYTVTDGVIRIQEPFLKSYDDRIWVQVSYLKNKVYHTENIQVEQKRELPKLDIELKTFRDHLLPGSKENWEVRLTSGGKTVQAEVLAMMYDASLDKIRPYSFRLEPGYARIYFYNNFSVTMKKDDFHYLIFQAKEAFQPVSIPLYQFDFLNRYNRTLANFMLGGIKYNGRGLMASPEYDADSFGDYVTGSADKRTIQSRAATVPASPMEVPLRTNFNETAFFYPQLVTDSAGCAAFSFTVPDAMTRWRFVVLATTKEMAYGQKEVYVTTSKPLMVRPNLPRFLRKGDDAEIKVTVSNLSDSLQAGKAVLELFVPESGETVYTQEANFRTEAQGSATVSFAVEVPEEFDVLACRMTAQSGNFSDGEQHYLPVLANEIMVNTTLPITLHEAGTHTFSLKEQGKKGQPYRLTFELAANPVWYAVQALPNLTEPRRENATEIAAAYYANAIAAEIARSNPRVAEALRQWQAQPDKGQASPLAEDAELKSVLLEASPWVSEAQSETDRIRRLAELFDENRRTYLQRQALDKLAELQTEDGGWGWFKGMFPSRFMTGNVLDILQRAALAGQEDPQGKVKDMQAKGVRYLDQGVVKDLERKHKELTYDDIIYLYVRSLYRDIPLGDALEAHKNLMALAEKQWGRKTPYEKALLAMAMYHYGQTKEAAKIIESVRQYATVTPEDGMYWAENRNGWFRNTAVQVQAAILEAFCLVEGENEETNAMRQWLLQQKRTQMWESVPSTVDAIHALLLEGNSSLEQREEPKVRIGRQTLEPSGMQDLFGIVRASYGAEEIRPDLLEVEITKQEDSPSWGGLYLQSLVPLEEIEAYGTELAVNKTLYVEGLDADGKTVLRPLAGSVKLGDKVVVRLTVTLERDMEFLHLQDLRAACFEPVEQLSGCRWQDGRIYYQETKDAATNLFFDFLPRGTYVFEYAVRVNQSGTFRDGNATLQCMYAPEFCAYSSAGEVVAEE